MHRFLGRLRSASKFARLRLSAAGNHSESHANCRPYEQIQLLVPRRYALQRTFAGLSTLIMSCAFTALFGCSTPADLDLSLDKSSDKGRYRVAIVPPSPAPAINQLHSWTIKLSTREGKPIEGASFTVSGGMPRHGHGYPTQPRVMRGLDKGTYLLDGMKFSMSGWWDLKLDIRAEGGLDQVTFNIVIDPKS